MATPKYATLPEFLANRSAWPNVKFDWVTAEANAPDDDLYHIVIREAAPKGVGTLLVGPTPPAELARQLLQGYGFSSVKLKGER